MRVMLRIGYFHDYYENGNKFDLNDRFLHVFYTYRDQFMAYAARVYETASVYDSYAGAFLCWEDFWDAVNVVKYSESEELRTQYTELLGYRDYLRTHYTIEEWNDLAGTSIESFDEAIIPAATEPAFRTFYEAYDELLISLLTDAQECVPNLSMEVRLDADLVTEPHGSQSYYSHSATFACEGSDYLATVYGIPMGFLNQGERLNADEACSMTESILKNLNIATNNKNLYVDQFLFYDDTVEFSHNARLLESEISPYLQQVSDVLQRYTCGIGVWTYQNYLFNAVYNWQFAEGLSGWNVAGEVTPLEKSGVHLAAGSKITQVIPADRTSFQNGETITLRFSAEDVVAPVEVSVTLNDTVQKVVLEQDGEYEMTFAFESAETLTLSFETNAGMRLCEIALYNHIQNGLLYDEHSSELANLSDLRELTASLCDVAGRKN